MRIRYIVTGCNQRKLFEKFKSACSFVRRFDTSEFLHYRLQVYDCENNCVVYLRRCGGQHLQQKQRDLMRSIIERKKAAGTFILHA